MQTRFVATRFLLLRLLGLVYATAFLVFLHQGPALIGSDGLLPAATFLDRVAAASGSRLDGFWRLPTLFWLDASDTTLRAAGVLGLGLSVAVLLGVTNAVVMAVLWALYLSITQVGQLFWSYGWESQLCETGLLAAALCPAFRLSPRASEPPAVGLWLNRWLIVRIMLGAGLIKLRGDDCWRDLTCLVWHYETQPNPNPLAWWLHQLPREAHMAGVAFNHLVELGAPLLAFWPRWGRATAGLLFITFQGVLIASGNLSFLNWLTIVPAIACFDDGHVARILPARVMAWMHAATPPPSRPHRVAAWAYAALVAWLSIGPVANLVSTRQAMNRSFDRLHLVNTYGAFGSVGEIRDEVIIEGTRDDMITDATVWVPYEFPCKPGAIDRRPCAISPYHYRFDWQLWFAAMSGIERQPWLVTFLAKLLTGDPTVKPLLAHDPFPTAPPTWLRIERYRYAMTSPTDGGQAWWKRTRVGPYLRPIRGDDPALQRYLREMR